MRKLKDDGKKIASFDISPDGVSIVWSTAEGKVFYSESGRKPVYIGRGSDPVWHPKKAQILYSAARMVGNKVIDHDIKLVDKRGQGKFLTITQTRNERWPRFLNEGRKIVFTVQNSTDLFSLVVKE